MEEITHPRDTNKRHHRRYEGSEIEPERPAPLRIMSSRSSKGYQNVTPTPSEKVSRWNRDISMSNSWCESSNHLDILNHSRQCVCSQCLDEYGTHRMYKQMMMPQSAKCNVLNKQPNNQKKLVKTYLGGGSMKYDQTKLFTRTPSSSGTSDISTPRIRHRIRVGPSCTERKCFICFSIAMVFIVIIASSGIYLGYQFLRWRSLPTEAVFRGNFVALLGTLSKSDAWSSQEEKNSRHYQHKLNLVFQRRESSFSKHYLHSEVFLLENNEFDNATKVHFNIHMDTKTGSPSAEQILHFLQNELYGGNKNASIFANIDIRKGSLDVQERSQFSMGETFAEDFSPKTENVKVAIKNKNAVDQRQCQNFDIDYCRHLPYNQTTFPNGMGHQTKHEAIQDLSWFMEVVDSKCYSLSYEFLCQLLQPMCYKSEIILPCRQFCLDFLQSCFNVLPNHLKNRIRCDQLASESDGPGQCISKPGCVASIRKSGREEQVCDGVVDCPDFSDELYCPYCPEHNFHCGVGRQCIPRSKMCDGYKDCDNGADEQGCLTLAPDMNFVSYVHHYYESGYLVYQEGGNAGKICADHMNKSVPSAEVDKVLNKLGRSICTMLEYKKLLSINIIKDASNRDVDKAVRYVDMIGPISTEKSFVEVDCQSRDVISVSCRELKCGRRPAIIQKNVRVSSPQGTPALHGDWPWLASLHKNGVHVCDGTLFDEQWIMTSASCFQGQGRAKWEARFASVRLSSRAPWEQRRRIVGLIKSPLEGNSIVILKMDKRIVFSDFSRPVCLPMSDEFIHLGAKCITLGWRHNDTQLRYIELEPASRKKCEEMTEVAPNTICTQRKADRFEFTEESDLTCDGEEVAGAPLLCQAGDEWHLVGVSAWRRGCSAVGRRPRLYDKVVSNTKWALDIINDSKKSDNNQIRTKQ